MINYSKLMLIVALVNAAIIADILLGYHVTLRVRKYEQGQIFWELRELRAKQNQFLGWIFRAWIMWETIPLILYLYGKMVTI